MPIYLCDDLTLHREEYPSIALHTCNTTPILAINAFRTPFQEKPPLLLHDKSQESLPYTIQP